LAEGDRVDLLDRRGRVGERGLDHLARFVDVVVGSLAGVDAAGGRIGVLAGRVQGSLVGEHDRVGGGTGGVALDDSHAERVRGRLDAEHPGHRARHEPAPL